MNEPKFTPGVTRGMKYAILFLLFALPSCSQDWEQISEQRGRTIDSLRLELRDAEERGIAIANAAPWVYRYDGFEPGEYARRCRADGHTWIGYPLEPVCLSCGIERRYVGLGDGWEYIDSLKASNEGKP